MILTTRLTAGYIRACRFCISGWPFGPDAGDEAVSAQSAATVSGAQDAESERTGAVLIRVLKLSRLGLIEEKDIIWLLAGRLQDLRSPSLPYSCWGYSFPWQTRTLLVERGAPNLVSTAFVANACLDLHGNVGNDVI